MAAAATKADAAVTTASYGLFCSLYFAADAAITTTALWAIHAATNNVHEINFFPPLRRGDFLFQLN